MAFRDSQEASEAGKKSKRGKGQATKLKELVEALGDLHKEERIEIYNRVRVMKLSEISEKIENGTFNALESVVASVFIGCANRGSISEFNELLYSFIGKPADKVEHSISEETLAEIEQVRIEIRERRAKRAANPE